METVHAANIMGKVKRELFLRWTKLQAMETYGGVGA
jgi:hypothetical protein